MKKKSLLIISVMLIAVLSIGIFAGCGSLSFSKAYGVNELKDTVQVSNVVLPDGATIITSHSNKNALVLKRNGNENALFSVAKNAIVVDWTTDSITSKKLNSKIVAWIIDSQNTTQNQLDTRVVDCEGIGIYNTFVGVSAAVAINKVAFGDFDYSIVLKSARQAKLIKDNKVVNVVDLGLSTPILENVSTNSDIFASDENYLYHLAQDAVAVYSLDTFKIVKLVGIENAVSLSDNGDLYTFLLSDGKALAQVVTKLPDEARSYDYVAIDQSTGKIEKHKLDSYIIDVVSGKTKKVKLDYVIDQIIGEAELSLKFPVKYNFENLFVVRKIINKSLASSNVAIGIDNNGKVVYTCQIDGMNGMVGMQVDNDKFIFMDITGGVHVVDMNGKILKSFGSAIAEDDVVYGVGILKGKGLYAFNGDTLKIFDEQTTVQNWGNSVVYEENGTFTRYTSQGETVIGSNVTFDSDLMVYLAYGEDSSVKISSVFSNAELVSLTAEEAQNMQTLNDKTRIVKKGNNATIIFKN